MQLISIFLLVSSIILLSLAISYLALWHHFHRKISLLRLLREGVAHIGISAIVEYPKTTAPLLALLEERYPYSEAIVIIDLQRDFETFRELIQQFALIKVNHTHFEGVRSLYRSHHRAFRRLVLIDLPIEQNHKAAEVAKMVAAYDYILQLHGESIIEADAISYCATIIASHHPTTPITIQNLVGADAQLEQIEYQNTPATRRHRIFADRALAWRKRGVYIPLITLLIPTALVLLSHFAKSRIVLLSAVISAIVVVSFLYLSCRITTKRGVFATLDTIVRNFYHYLAERVCDSRLLYNRVRIRAVPDKRRIFATKQSAQDQESL